MIVKYTSINLKVFPIRFLSNLKGFVLCINIGGNHSKTPVSLFFFSNQNDPEVKNSKRDQGWGIPSRTAYVQQSLAWQENKKKSLF